MSDEELSDGENEVEYAFETCEEWVQQYFASTFTRPIGGQFRWCAHWQEHPEALLRLTVLWHSWEAAKEDLADGGLSIWLHDHLDYHVNELMSPTGPFARCTPQRHEPSAPLPVSLGEYRRYSSCWATRVR